LNGSNKSTLLNLIYTAFPESQAMPPLGSYAAGLTLSDDTQRTFACFSVENEA
jgi:ABC-type molybdenum transport system ATPase subunit/photorepair protein PhrA